MLKCESSTPLNQVPTLHVNDVQITQSDAITRYVGKLAGLYPEDAFQALLCDEALGALEDINIKIGATFGLTGDDLKIARGALATGALPKYLQWLQHQLESHGGEFLADHRLTIADLKAFVILRWLSSGKLDYIPSELIATAAPETQRLYESYRPNSCHRTVLCRSQITERQRPQNCFHYYSRKFTNQRFFRFFAVS